MKDTGKQVKVICSSIDKKEVTNYIAYLHMSDDPRSKMTSEKVDIMFVNGKFYHAKYKFSGTYRRNEWKMLAQIEKIITKIEKDIAKNKVK